MGVSAGVVDDVETVDIQNDYPEIVVEHLAGIVDEIALFKELVAVCSLSYVVHVAELLDTDILFVLVGDIKDCAAEKRQSIVRALDGLEAVGVPAVQCIRGFYTHLHAPDFLAVHSLESVVEDYTVVGVHQ